MASGSARLGSVWHFSARIGSVGLGSARFGSGRHGLARLGSARLGTARLGSARLGFSSLYQKKRKNNDPQEEIILRSGTKAYDSSKKRKATIHKKRLYCDLTNFACRPLRECEKRTTSTPLIVERNVRFRNAPGVRRRAQRWPSAPGLF